MKIAFVDVVDWDYDADTPSEQPLGGTQSAGAYLAAALAALGTEVVYVNGTRDPHVSRGARFVGRAQASPALFNACDFVVVMSAALGRTFRDEFGVTRPLIFWSGHAHTEDAVRALGDRRERDAWSAYALVSDWQAQQYRERFAIPAGRIGVLRNAVSPAFLELDAVAPWFDRGEPPVIAYTSTPFRGLEILLLAFPAIRKAMPEARLRVFSSMAVYRMTGGADRFGMLYDLCRALPGAEYFGALPQRTLAREMAKTAALSYPCTFPETSCIAAMEAMACGAELITTRMGALPETAHGFGRLLSLEGDRIDFAARFAAAVAESLATMKADPAAARRRRDEQLAFARSEYTWERRARQWLDWLGASNW